MLKADIKLELVDYQCYQRVISRQLGIQLLMTISNGPDKPAKDSNQMNQIQNGTKISTSRLESSIGVLTPNCQ